MTTKALKHLLNATEVNDQQKWSRNMSKCKMALYHYSDQIFKQNPLFFIIQVCDNQRKAFLYLKFLLGNNFSQFDKYPGKCTRKTR